MAQYLGALITQDLGLGTIRTVLKLSQHATNEDIARLAIRAALVGSAALLLRRLTQWLKAFVEREFYPTAYIAATDVSYTWVMSWLSQDPAVQAQIKNFQLSTTESRQTKLGSKNGLKGSFAQRNWKVGGLETNLASEEIIGQVLPMYNHNILIKHDGCWLWVSRRVNGFLGRGAVDHIQISTMMWNQNAIKNFLSAAHARYFDKQDEELLIFHPDCVGTKITLWLKPICRPSRSWSSVILPRDIKEDLLEDIEKFLNAKEWYNLRGIPHRRGYMMHGSPGSGKTTLATAIASKLGLDIYVINPSQKGMDDSNLGKLFRDCPARSVILIEDIDCVFPTQRRVPRTTFSQDATNDLDTTDPTNTTQMDDMIEETPAPLVKPIDNIYQSTVTLSGLLNAIDGVSSQEGCILIASTNYPNHLDPALRRPGRFDVQIAFTPATHSQAKALFNHFYPITTALTGKNNDSDSEATEYPEDLATVFADAVIPTAYGINEKRMSMAALQGYLLGYMDDPTGAALCAKVWAEGFNEDLAPRKVVGAPTVKATVGKKVKGSKIKAAQKAPVVDDSLPGNRKTESQEGLKVDMINDEA